MIDLTKPPPDAKVRALATEYLNTPLTSMQGKTYNERILVPREILTYLLHFHCGTPFWDLARLFGHGTHSTAIASLHRLHRRCVAAQPILTQGRSTPRTMTETINDVERYCGLTLSNPHQTLCDFKLSPRNLRDNREDGSPCSVEEPTSLHTQPAN